MPRVFLTAEWRNLVIVSYRVPARIVAPFLPDGLELEPIGPGDPTDGTASLVAFQFLRTRVFGVAWPGMVNFPEWNLRFYVRTKPGSHAGTEPRRGVVFVQEFVPSRVVSFVAQRMYNEPYAAAPFEQRISSDAGHASARYRVQFGGGAHTIEATASPALWTPEESSDSHLLKEHQWGFGRTRAGRTLCYEVQHPVWRIHRDARADVQIDWSALYGPQWSIMQNATPFSTLLVEGSSVKVMQGVCL